MSYVAVTRKDFRDGIRSRLLWGLIALFFVSIVAISTLYSEEPAELGGVFGEFGVLVLFAFSAMPAILVLVPVSGLLVSIKSIARERELGSIKLLLSLPHNRREVLVGKFVGRSAVLTVAVLAGFVPGAAVLAVRFGGFPVIEFVGLLAVTVLFGIAFVAVGLGVSAMVATETRATVTGVSAFFVLYFWDSAFTYLNDQLDLLTGNAVLFVERFNLLTVYFDALLALVSLRQDVPNASTVAFREFAEGTTQPIYLQHWFAFLILALWIVVPLLVGYWRFANADL